MSPFYKNQLLEIVDINLCKCNGCLVCIMQMLHIFKYHTLTKLFWNSDRYGGSIIWGGIRCMHDKKSLMLCDIVEYIFWGTMFCQLLLTLNKYLLAGLFCWELLYYTFTKCKINYVLSCIKGQRVGVKKGNYVLED